LRSVDERERRGEIMPYRTPKSCNVPGCPLTTLEGPYCKTHEHLVKEQKRSYQRKYDKSNPGDVFYGSARWKKLRAWYRAQNPLCEDCLKEGRITKTYLVDHIVSILDGGDPMAVENLQSFCVSCHNRKHKGK